MSRLRAVTVDPTWIEHADEASAQLFENTLGPLIAADASRLAPRDTGYMAKHIDFRVEATLFGSILFVESHADYSAWVELGHRNVAWGKQPPHATGRDYIEAQPFLRPALYITRGAT